MFAAFASSPYRRRSLLLLLLLPLPLLLLLLLTIMMKKPLLRNRRSAMMMCVMRAVNSMNSATIRRLGQVQTRRCFFCFLRPSVDFTLV